MDNTVGSLTQLQKSVIIGSSIDPFIIPSIKYKLSYDPVETSSHK